jgi:pyruvate formate lyase activating enzyme
MICGICPHFCELEPGDVGKCLVRKNTGSRIEVPESHVSLLAVEPIEKRPFFHFLPGSRWLSIGLYGCSFSCDFCQNFRVSQSTEQTPKLLSPVDLWNLAVEKGTSGVVFTYNEPTVHYEYLDQVGITLFERPLIPYMRMCVKTNGFVNVPILREMVTYVDAFNVDIKGDEAEYEAVCGGRLQPVLDAIEFLACEGNHLEISYLVLPRLLDNQYHHRFVRDFLAALGADIPVHILYFYPFHRMPHESYRPEQLLPVVDLFREKMNYVYVSNCFDSAVVVFRDTVCKTCGSVMISREREILVDKTECCGQRIRNFALPKQI